MKEASAHPSNFRQQKTLHDVLELHQIPGIAGVDTRSITRKIRQHGVLKAGLLIEKKILINLSNIYNK
ncbi:carbamoyl-phosphate synthase small subunit [Staphylococcus aureus]|uniref:Carbamoyl-phosphate synthase small subunit n=1 Tax=Staphylococcus aureus TaxID=1280 RepID=A0A380E114_STAAU|nr:carbamoyl-phosphate synthase small subunit [Staphylococcus aureus]